MCFGAVWLGFPAPKPAGREAIEDRHETSAVVPGIALEALCGHLRPSVIEGAPLWYGSRLALDGAAARGECSRPLYTGPAKIIRLTDGRSLGPLPQVAPAVQAA